MRRGRWIQEAGGLKGQDLDGAFLSSLSSASKFDEPGPPLISPMVGVTKPESG